MSEVSREEIVFHNTTPSRSAPLGGALKECQKVKVLIAKDGTPVVVGAIKYRKSHRFGGRKPKKEELRRKGLLGKIPRSEMMLLTLRQRDALRNFVEAGLDPSKKAACAVAAALSAKPEAAAKSRTTKDSLRVRHQAGERGEII